MNRPEHSSYSSSAITTIPWNEERLRATRNGSVFVGYERGKISGSLCGLILFQVCLTLFAYTVFNDNITQYFLVCRFSLTLQVARDHMRMLL